MENDKQTKREKESNHIFSKYKKIKIREIRELFLKYFVEVFKDYEMFVDKDSIDESFIDKSFDSENFIKKNHKESAIFFEECFFKSQMWAIFL